MNTKNSKSSGSLIFPCLITVLIAVTLLFSCKKSNLKTEYEKNDMVVATKVLNGNLLLGNVTSESNKDVIAFNYNFGSQFIIIEKLPGVEPFSINSIPSAEVITSKFGVIVKDLRNNKIFLLTNNDSESFKIFEEVKSLFGNNIQISKIFGVTIVNVGMV